MPESRYKLIKMPFETSFDHPRRLMITRAWGRITLADLRTYQQELSQRSEFDPAWARVRCAGRRLRRDCDARVRGAEYTDAFGV